MDLFNAPANAFVAGFLGSPKMNFFEGHLSELTSRGGYFQGAEFEGGLVRIVGRKQPGQAVTLGIRPQHLILDPNGALSGKVTLIERLGTETVVELITASGTPFRFTTSETVELEHGQDADFSFDPDLAHLF
jgi:ABC-type sugar transport system ATPase subunit